MDKTLAPRGLALSIILCACHPFDTAELDPPDRSSFSAADVRTMTASRTEDHAIARYEASPRPEGQEPDAAIEEPPPPEEADRVADPRKWREDCANTPLRQYETIENKPDGTGCRVVLDRERVKLFRQCRGEIRAFVSQTCKASLEKKTKNLDRRVTRKKTAMAVVGGLTAGLSAFGGATAGLSAARDNPDFGVGFGIASAAVGMVGGIVLAVIGARNDDQLVALQKQRDVATQTFSEVQSLFLDDSQNLWAPTLARALEECDTTRALLREQLKASCHEFID